MRPSRQILKGFMYLARFAQRQDRPIVALFPWPIPRRWMVIWSISVNSFLPLNISWWCWIVRDGIVQRPFVLPRIWPYFCCRRIVRNWIRWSWFSGRCVTSILGIKCSRRLNSWIGRLLMPGVMLLAVPKPSVPCAFLPGLNRQSITKIGIKNRIKNGFWLLKKGTSKQMTCAFFISAIVQVGKRLPALYVFEQQKGPQSRYC